MPLTLRRLHRPTLADPAHALHSSEFTKQLIYDRRALSTGPVKSQMSLSYGYLLKRLRDNLRPTSDRPRTARLELPEPAVIWIGNKTILRNFAEFPRLLRRDQGRLLMFLAKELATAASLDGERAIFIGRKDRQSFSVLINRYLKEYVTCPVCGSPDTHVERAKRLHFLVCEACGARSSAKEAA